MIQSVAQGVIATISTNQNMVKLSDIAAKAGVSESTASRALANNPRISEETKQLVQRLAIESGYKVNHVARNLRARSTLTIGLVVPEVSNPFFPKLVQLVSDSARESGYRLQLHLSGIAQDSEAQCLASLSEQRVDGIVLVTSESGLVARDALNEIVASRIPVVLLGWVSDAPEVDMVYGDDASGGYQLAKHLVGLGHRRIAILGAVPHRGPFDRLVGFRKGLAEVDGVSEMEIPARTSEEIKLEIDSLLNLPNPPTAIFAYQDSLAAIACRCLRQSCVSIPDQMSVVGFDNLDLGTYLCPQLTTVDLSMERLASAAVEALVRRMKVPPSGEVCEQLLIPPQLVLRESSSRPRSANAIEKSGCPPTGSAPCDSREKQS